MEKYDLIVIGSGAGMNVASRATGQGMRVALIEHGPIGGTCLNTGCIPSKILIYPADIARIIDSARAIGIECQIERIDVPLIMRRMRSFVEEERRMMEMGVEATDNLDWYRETGEFVGDYQLKVGGEIITAAKIVIASGSRALVPPIPGLKEAGYLDNASLLSQSKLPQSIVLLGGGYIACEYGHFFSAMGSKVTILGRSPQLLKNEDPEISKIVEKGLSKYVDLLTNYEVVRVEGKAGKKVVFAVNRSTGAIEEFSCDEILVAAGRRSNADLLKPDKTGVETDRGGWIKVDEYLETTKRGIWAFGDAIGKHMFRHTANYESRVVWKNAFTEEKVKVDYHAVPHAVFTYPQVGSVGMSEKEARALGFDILVGKAWYRDVAKGYAMGDLDGFVKVVVNRRNGRILGSQIAGEGAPDLVQQITYLMNTEEQNYEPMRRAQVIHPALSEVLVHAFANLHQSED